jgi:hypothetical protein
MQTRAQWAHVTPRLKKGEKITRTSHLTVDDSLPIPKLTMPACFQDPFGF